MESAAAILVLPLAFGLDGLLGDPARLPHPVRWMGRMILAAEPRFRRIAAGGVAAGALFAAVMVFSAGGAAYLAVRAAAAVDPIAGWMVETVLVYYALSVQSLRTAALAVHRDLTRGSRQQARRSVAQIVGRDTRRLDAVGISRATVETVAENLVDGVVSPLFYAALGGAPLAMAYKMVSTLDSMVGYKNPRYIRFGKASARLDDAANYIPARLAVPLIALAARILHRRGRQALKTALRDGGQHSSPNAGRPEAAFAGALAVKLGGPSVYDGQTVAKPYIGARFGEAGPQHIPQACRLMVAASILALGAAGMIRALVVALGA